MNIFKYTIFVFCDKGQRYGMNLYYEGKEIIHKLLRCSKNREEVFPQHNSPCSGKRILGHGNSVH